MSRNLQKSSDDTDVKYGSEVQVLCDWVDTTNMVLIGGRGMAKSTVIIARRSLRCVYEMPGAPIAIVANTYANLVNNIMPAVQNGWRLQGLIEDVHYVKGRRPPEKWRRQCSVIVDDYKYCYTFRNGTTLFLGSLDNPSLLAGKSVAHLIFDEAKYANEAKASRVMPILRGDAITYGRSHLYGGVTITTDMPDISNGEHDWFFRYAAEMDPQSIITIVQTASLRNKALLRLHKANAEVPADVRKIGRCERKVEYYDNALRTMRRGQTYFCNVSSFANIDILTLDYARRMYEGALELHEFLKSVLGMRPGLKRSSRFYVGFTDEHKYTDGTYTGAPAYRSGELRYLRPDQLIDGGMDFGNMLSLVIAQPDGAYYRVHKNIYQLAPGYIRDLADQFLEFFADHPTKVLHLYYDRAGNAYQRQNEDSAGKVKQAIETDAEGRRTGWAVELMSRHQATIRQGAEYAFMQELMSGRCSQLPRLLVDAVNCQEMVSSIELARAEVTYRGETKIVKKVKKSEKLPLGKLPRLSTNFSDAFKYLMMRRDWIKAAGSAPTGNTGADSMVDQWLAKRNTE